MDNQKMTKKQLSKSFFMKAQSSNLIDASTAKEFIKNSMLEEQLFGMKQDRKLRLYFSAAVLFGVAVYVGFIIDIVYKCGHLFNFFHLSDMVLATLLSTTTANIVAVLVLVVRYLFPQKTTSNEN